ncbi:mechanosensitive ion channel domain-containing protein [Agrilactobacillus fermenti]|uniref:mechanosensitive ion channel domain-containing protein n=1 Tax=Agrilactobacillus fermenti TaxID=2586909 RepID=UPI001E6538EA|nr:mechanosensitive ion channel domain-containing protein [Agrilactobacillus fermenti]
MQTEVNKVIDAVSHKVIQNINNSGELSGKLVLSVILIFIWFLCERLLTKLWPRLIDNIKILNAVHGISTNLLRLIFSIALIWVWLNALDTFLIIAILIVVVLTISVKGLFSNLVGWFLIVYKHHFRLYDRIEMGGIKGEVIGIKPLYFTLMELSNWFEEDAPTGRTIKIPNRDILTKPIYNYANMTPFLWKELSYLVTFDSDWEQALTIIKELANENYQTFVKRFLADEKSKTRTLKQLALFDGQPNPETVVTVKEKGIVLKVRFIVHYKEGTKVITELNQKILMAFKNHQNIRMAGDVWYLTTFKPERSQNQE